MKIYTSYFWQIRNFTPNIIPVSTAMSDPIWYRPPAGMEYYKDKRGIINGLRYEPLIVQRYGTCSCPCSDKERAPACPTMIEYEQLLFSLVDKEKTLKAFEHCCNKFNCNVVCLMVYENNKNPCSERFALQKFFDCDEWSL